MSKIREKALAMFPVPGRTLWVAIVETQPTRWAIGTCDSFDAEEWRDCLSLLDLQNAVGLAADRVERLTPLGMLPTA